MTTDFCDDDGARKLKAKIEEYWSTRGFDVRINLIDAGFVPVMRSARTDVRSNMVNGMPPRKKKAPFVIESIAPTRPPMDTRSTGEIQRLRRRSGIRRPRT